ncbi:hypothetical protein MBLNU230_g2983t1 [Neophaeotheca triangularis]
MAANTNASGPDGTSEPTLPIAIFTLAHRYLLYDVNAITYLRKNHNIIGVLIGGLPQAPQQNVFQGIPLELMPEEARLLVDKGIAYIVDDTKAHKQDFLQNGLSGEEKRAYEACLRRQGMAAAKGFQKESEERRKAGLAKKMQATNAGGDWNDLPEDMLQPSSSAGKGKRKPSKRRAEPTAAASGNGSAMPTPPMPHLARQPSEDESLFGPPSTSGPPRSRRESDETSTTAASSIVEPELEPWPNTPTTTYPPLTLSQQTESLPLPPVSASSYPLYKHMHENGYFLAPGLRFGSQYMAYPGDPLRFHSHFLCKGLEWEEEFDLLELVGGGRLGTGVKKGYLLGGEEKENDKVDDSKGTRTFCIEWGGM